MSPLMRISGNRIKICCIQAYWICKLYNKLDPKMELLYQNAIFSAKVVINAESLSHHRFQWMIWGYHHFRKPPYRHNGNYDYVMVDTSMILYSFNGNFRTLKWRYGTISDIYIYIVCNHIYIYTHSTICCCDIPYIRIWVKISYFTNLKWGHLRIIPLTNYVTMIPVRSRSGHMFILTEGKSNSLRMMFPAN